MTNRKAPACRVCGNHPRSALHKNQCGIRGPKPLKSSKPDISDAKTLLEGWVLSKTCISCRTTFTQTPLPDFQDEDAKQGKYDVLKQLPHTSKDYPLCQTCLGWYWKTEGARWGMEKEVKEVYG